MIVFTNGCFDILHPGHVDLLKRARSLGSKLIVGVNSDASVRRIKGKNRPLITERERADVLLGLESVDEVHIFDEATPEKLIRQIRPDILVKGGDWKPSEIIGSDFVKQYGGEVVSLPLLEGFSSSRIVERIEAPIDETKSTAADSVTASFDQHLTVLNELADTGLDAVRESAKLILDTFLSGNKVLICGNGGSAADAQHIAAEFVGRYETERRALPAIALTTDTSALTAVANDYGIDVMFARQVDALAAAGDCLIAISTSGTSANVIAAVMAARTHGCKVIGMTGANGKKLASLCDTCIIVPSERTARVQEAHITVAHIWCEVVDIHLATHSGGDAFQI